MEIHSVREYSGSNGDWHIDVDCDCHGCMLRAVQFGAWTEEDPYFSISFWSQLGRRLSFLNRFRAAWQMLRYGHGFEEVIVCRETAKNFGKALIRACQEKGHDSSQQA